MAKTRDTQAPTRSNPRGKEWMSAAQAAALLGVKRATLYTYVSRGLVRCVPEPGTKENRYIREDLERLKARHDARAGHAAVAAGALRWGEPVIDSAVSQVGTQGLTYRGHSAVQLAVEGWSLEEVAELLWNRTPPLRGVHWPSPEPRPQLLEMVKLLPPHASPLAVLASLVPLLGAWNPVGSSAPAEQERLGGRHLLRHLAAWVFAAQVPTRVTPALAQETLAGSLCKAWDVTAKRAPELLNSALVLCADHELNASTFAARVAASAGADLYACVSAALAALSGPRHGASCDRLDALLREIGRPERVRRTVHERLRRGEAIPGFGHLLYPQGDPRASPLLEAAYAMRPERSAVRLVRALEETMRDAGYPEPTVDLGLVAVASALGLPPGAATALFAVGRAAGWVAHVLEQRESPHILRPRARYVGESVPSTD